MFTLIFKAKALKSLKKENKHLKKSIAIVSQISNYPGAISQMHSSLWVIKSLLGVQYCAKHYGEWKKK